jgi:hypothetical protein
MCFRAGAAWQRQETKEPLRNGGSREDEAISSDADDSPSPGRDLSVDDSRSHPVIASRSA